jgi:hypothetical protein
MFIQNKYYRWYYSIVNFRKQHAPEGYSENHHIVPRSLGGSNKKDNIVKLTAKEHFICHRLLVKMVEGRDKMKMSYAIRCMMLKENPHQQRYKITSNKYRSIVEKTKMHISEFLKGENNPYYGKTHSSEVRQKMKEKRSQQVMPKREGKVYSDELLIKWREAHKKQFLDPKQKELRRKANAERRERVGPEQGWHDPITSVFKFFPIGHQPEGWVKGRFKKKEG